jgi:molybdate transport system substrate-binding protein
MSGCDPYKHPTITEKNRKEILIYCGVTMASAVSELISILEERTDCKVSALYGGSGHLKNIIEVNKKGDLFFPGSSQYLEDLKTEGVIGRTEEVGYNSLSFFVKKGNPLQITNNIKNLSDVSLNVVLGSENAGSVGRETAYLLEKHNIKDEVISKSIYVTNDSKGIARSIRNGDADLTVNWLATGYLPENTEFVTPIKIDSPYVRQLKLVIGQLIYSDEKECSGSFLDIASSVEGKEIFAKYGFAE